MRGIFFESADAESAAARLRHDGWTAQVVPEPLAGEDDDEAHPYAVLSDAPEMVLDLVVDEYDGWLDVEEVTPRRPPLDLPPAPQRIKREST